MTYDVLVKLAVDLTLPALLHIHYAASHCFRSYTFVYFFLGGARAEYIGFLVFSSASQIRIHEF